MHRTLSSDLDRLRMHRAGGTDAGDENVSGGVDGDGAGGERGKGGMGYGECLEDFWQRC